MLSLKASLPTAEGLTRNDRIGNVKNERFVGKKQKKENSTTEKADAETKTAAGADAEGGAQLTQLLGVDLRKLPHQTLLLAFLSHPSLLQFSFSRVPIFFCNTCTHLAIGIGFGGA
jgi:hypothetical protein